MPHSRYKSKDGSQLYEPSFVIQDECQFLFLYTKFIRVTWFVTLETYNIYVGRKPCTNLLSGIRFSQMTNAACRVNRHIMQLMAGWCGNRELCTINRDCRSSKICSLSIILWTKQIVTHTISYLTESNIRCQRLRYTGKFAVCYNEISSCLRKRQSQARAVFSQQQSSYKSVTGQLWVSYESITSLLYLCSSSAAGPLYLRCKLEANSNQTRTKVDKIAEPVRICFEFGSTLVQKMSKGSAEEERRYYRLTAIFGQNPFFYHV